MAVHVFSSQSEKKFGKSLGVVATLAVHAVILLLLLSGKTPIQHPDQVLLTARLISESPLDNPEPTRIQNQPEFKTPQLSVPLPELAVASEPAASPIQIAAIHSAPKSAEPVSDRAPDSLPQFDADYLNNPSPVYPRVSRRLREVGTVTLHVFVSPTGLPVTIEIDKSSGFARLDEAALEAVRKWNFTPAKKAGVAIGAWVAVPVDFSLSS